MHTIQVGIQGVEPGLLMHRFSEVAQAGLVNPVNLQGKTKPRPEDEAEQGAYRLESGELCLPAHNIFEACVSAAAQHQVAGQGKKTYKDLVKGGVVIEPQYVILHNGNGPLTTYEIDQRPVRIGRARIIRARPLLREWRAQFTVAILDDQMVPSEVMHSIIVRAGQVKGVGDYRPLYGRFIVTQFEP